MGRAFQLEYSYGVASPEPFVGRGVIQRDPVVIQLLACFPHVLQGILYRPQCPQGKQVYLHEPQIFHVVLVKLDDGDPLGRILDRAQVSYGMPGYNQPAQMSRQKPGKPRKPLRSFKKRFEFLGRKEIFEFGHKVEFLREFGRREVVRHALGDHVYLVRRVPHGFPDLPYGRSPLKGVVRGHGGDVLFPVLPSHVSRHVVPAPGVEIDVYVGFFTPLKAQKPFKQEVLGDWVDVRHVQAIGNGGIRRRTPARMPDALVSGKQDQVPHNQEVILVPQFLDDVKLVVQPPFNLVRDLPVPLLGSLKNQVTQKSRGRRVAFRHGKRRETGHPKFHRDLALGRDLDRRPKRPRILLESQGHLIFAL